MKKFIAIIFCFISFSTNAKYQEGYVEDFEKEYKVELAFIEKIKPIALEVNLEVLKERALIEAIDLENLSQKDKDLLDEKAEKYDEFTRLKDNNRYIYLREKLLDKIDAMPPSMLIAVSGIETDFGRTRFVDEGNSLYKEVVWDDSGIKPIGEDEDAGYTIKKFNTLKDSMHSFLLKLNSSRDFAHLRFGRKLQRQKRRPMQGRDFAQDFHLRTPLKNFTGLLDYTITFYELDELDRQNNYYR
ncbi:MAG: hypothetical protein R3Y43_05045 [Alphaproteobacteria bacterium]